MTRILIFFAVIGSFGGVFCLGLGFTLSGWDWARAASWSLASQSTCGPMTSDRIQVTLPFTTRDDSLAITLPGSVRYRPGDKAEALVSGDAAVVDHVRIEDGILSLDCDAGSSKLEVDLTGPAITNWKLLGSAKLTLAGISQRELRLKIAGSGGVTAGGAVETLGLQMSGSGKAELKGLVTKSAEIDATGSGSTQLTAEGSADVSIAGSGSVELFGHPNVGRSKTTGSGRIVLVP